jgi:hypothetical protein
MSFGWKAERSRTRRHLLSLFPGLTAAALNPDKNGATAIADVPIRDTCARPRTLRSRATRKPGGWGRRFAIHSGATYHAD